MWTKSWHGRFGHEPFGFQIGSYQARSVCSFVCTDNMVFIEEVLHETEDEEKKKMFGMAVRCSAATATRGDHECIIDENLSTN